MSTAMFTNAVDHFHNYSVYYEVHNILIFIIFFISIYYEVHNIFIFIIFFISSVYLKFIICFDLSVSCEGHNTRPSGFRF